MASTAVARGAVSFRSAAGRVNQSSNKVRGQVCRAEEYGASHTSFYTTTEKQDSYDDLDTVLANKCSDPQLRAVIV